MTATDDQDRRQVRCIHPDRIAQAQCGRPAEQGNRDPGQPVQGHGRAEPAAYPLGAGRGEMCVCDLAGLLEASESAVSHQLRLLRQLALVQNRRQGQVLYYRLADDHIQTLVRTALEHIRE